ncbi:MAG: hypothetical protein ACE5J4_03375 [Candidatus Aenigmatarchaeota archaeon]
MKYILTLRDGEDAYRLINGGEKVCRMFDKNEINYDKLFLIDVVGMKIEIESGELPLEVYEELEKDWNVERSRKSVEVVEANKRSIRMGSSVDRRFR